MTRLLAIASGLAFAVVSSCPALSRADDQDVIDYRVHIMKTMEEEMGAITQILQKKVPPDYFATHVKILAVTAATAKSAFTPKTPGGNAGPNIWAQWPDFAKRLDELTAVTADLAKTAASGGVTATAAKLQADLDC